MGRLFGLGCALSDAAQALLTSCRTAGSTHTVPAFGLPRRQEESKVDPLRLPLSAHQAFMPEPFATSQQPEADDSALEPRLLLLLAAGEQLYAIPTEAVVEVIP